MDLICTVTTAKWKMSISSAVHVERAIDTCVKCIASLPASYKELEVIFGEMCVQVVKVMHYFWATVCKMVCPMLLDRCPVSSVLSVCL